MNVRCLYFTGHLTEPYLAMTKAFDSRSNLRYIVKLTWTVIYYYWRQSYFFYRTFIQNRVLLARCMSWLISFALASSSCKDRKRELQNENFLSTAGARTHDPVIVKLKPLPLAHETWYAIKKLRLNQVIPVLFISASWHAAEFLSCIQYYNHIACVSFCGSTNIYSILAKQQNDTYVIWEQYWIHNTLPRLMMHT